jgi:bacillithiol system protein YtxJ
MQWQEITSVSEADAVLAASEHKPQLVLKHSTRCSISTMAKSRLERAIAASPVQPADLHLLKVIEARPASNHLAERLGVYHQSPQLLLVENGECLLEQDHLDISWQEVLETLQQQS